MRTKPSRSGLCGDFQSLVSEYALLQARGRETFETFEFASVEASRHTDYGKCSLVSTGILGAPRGLEVLIGEAAEGASRRLGLFLRLVKDSDCPPQSIPVASSFPLPLVPFPTCSTPAIICGRHA